MTLLIKLHKLNYLKSLLVDEACTVNQDLSLTSDNSDNDLLMERFADSQ